MISPVPASVGLTFDDGPDPVWTPRVLTALRRADARATFFACGPAVRANPELVRRILDEGHAVGFHCDDHVRHSNRSEADLRADTERGLNALSRAGATPRLWRTPWGDVSADTEAVAREFGLEVVGWTADTHDWRGDTASEMLERVSPELAPGAIVLMHDGLGPGARRTTCAETATLVGPLVERARAEGLEPRALHAAATAEAVPEPA